MAFCLISGHHRLGNAHMVLTWVETDRNVHTTPNTEDVHTSSKYSYSIFISSASLLALRHPQSLYCHNHFLDYNNYIVLGIDIKCTYNHGYKNEGKKKI